MSINRLNEAKMVRAYLRLIHSSESLSVYGRSPSIASLRLLSSTQKAGNPKANADLKMSPEEKWDRVRDFYEKKMRTATRDSKWAFKNTPTHEQIEWLYTEWKKFTEFVINS